MDKGTQIYQGFIDDLVKMSRDCADAVCVRRGEVCGVAAQGGINRVLGKLCDSEREILAKYLIDVYSAGIYDTLEQLEWLRECKDMVIAADGEALPIGKYEGIPNDFIGRQSGDWEWPKT